MTGRPCKCQVAPPSVVRNTTQQPALVSRPAIQPFCCVTERDARQGGDEGGRRLSLPGQPPVRRVDDLRAVADRPAVQGVRPGDRSQRTVPDRRARALRPGGACVGRVEQRAVGAHSPAVVGVDEVDAVEVDARQPLPAACRASRRNPRRRCAAHGRRAHRPGGVGIEGADRRETAIPRCRPRRLRAPALAAVASVDDAGRHRAYAAADQPAALVIAEAERHPARGVGGKDRLGYVDCCPRGAAVGRVVDRGAVGARLPRWVPSPPNPAAAYGSSIR